jgi:hypothetical protein
MYGEAEVARLEGELLQYKLRVSQLEVQLAGCGVAALGWSQGEHKAKLGDYGWSASYGDVLSLRARYELLVNARRVPGRRPRVVIESPLSPANGRTFEQNIRYARLCALDCYRRGGAPYASHLLCTQFLDDATPEERAGGMQVGASWNDAAEKAEVFTDFGVSGGMSAGIAQHSENGTPIEHRQLPLDLLLLVDAVGGGTKGIDE